MNAKGLKLYNEVSKILEAPIYLVGGCVRDFLLGIEPKDYDFITPISPDEIEQKIRNINKKPYLVGKKFGTIGVKIEGELVEITTFRKETYSSGSRKPEVSFVSHIEEDLSRRDFTINAIAWRDGHLIDPFNGQEDLKNKIIKAVGVARQRFNEDPLRMLRAIRFAIRFNFSLEDITFKRIKELDYRILKISKERWMLELDKILMEPSVVRGLLLLQTSGLMRFMIPELAIQYNYNQNNKHHAFTLFDHTCLVVENVPYNLNLKWGALLHDIAKPFVRKDKIDRSTYVHHELLGAEIVESIARRLKWSNERREFVVELVRNHLLENSPLKKADMLSKGVKDEA